MGYGYGIWLIPNESAGYSTVQTYNSKPHIRHVTLACNMSYDDACNMLLELHIRNIVPRNGWIIPLIKKFESSYKEDCIFAAGWNLFVYDWFKFEGIIGKKGQVPSKPHMSILYSKREINDVIIKHLRKYDVEANRNLTFFPVVADITSDNPHEWYIKFLLS